MSVTIYTSGLNILAHKGLTFRSANEVKNHLSKKDVALLRSQPGYKSGQLMTLSFRNDGLRLYAQINGAWMDASLQAINTD